MVTGTVWPSYRNEPTTAKAVHSVTSNYMSVSDSCPSKGTGQKRKQAARLAEALCSSCGCERLRIQNMRKREPNGIHAERVWTGALTEMLSLTGNQTRGSEGHKEMPFFHPAG